MRRYVSPLLVGLGAFLLVAALLLRFYAYPSLAKVPSNYESVTELQGEGVTVFSLSLLEPVVTDLYTSSNTVAQASSDVPEGCVVWANSTSTRTGDPDGIIFQRSRDLSTFDETTGAACENDADFNESVEGERVSVQREGQIYKMPFDTEKRDYPWWDGVLGEAPTMEYIGTEEIDGLEVYEFRQDIPPTVVDTRTLPGSIFGLEEPSVEAEVVYSMVRTLFIEPSTGSPVDRTEERTQVLRYEDIEVPAFVGTVEYADETVEANVEDYKSKASALSGLGSTYPLVLGVLGLVLMVVGFLLSRRGRGRDGTHSRQDDLVHA